jgi:hypothetical protein
MMEESGEGQIYLKKDTRSSDRHELDLAKPAQRSGMHAAHVVCQFPWGSAARDPS